MISSDPAREWGEATARGLNVLYELAHGPLEPDGHDAAKADWIAALEALAVALEHARDPGIETDYHASPEQIADVRVVAALVADWLKTGHRSEDIASQAGALYTALNE
ncbi:MAG: hypothetical protein R3F14_10845 [Polyangiaceae bacterium]